MKAVGRVRGAPDARVGDTGRMSGVVRQGRESGSARLARRRRAPDERPYALVWAVVTAAAFGIALWLLVTWDWLPGGDLAPIDPTGGLTADELAHIERFQSSMRWWQLGQLFAPLLVLLLLGFTRLGSWTVWRLPGTDRIWPLRLMLAALATVGAAWAAQLPFAAGVEHTRNAEGFVARGWTAWMQGQVGSLFTYWAFVSLGVLLIGLAARAMRRWWWCALSLACGVLVMIGAWAAGQLGTSSSGLPSMPAGPLRSSLLELSAEMGVEVHDIKVVPESSTVQVFNAFVAPVSDGHEVVVYETMLNRATSDEVRFVAAHELTHIDQADGRTSAVLLGLGVMTGAAFVGATATSRPLLRRAGASRAVADPTAVPLLVALSVVAAIVVVPVLDATSRAVEARADVAAMDVTGDPDGLIRLQRRLAVLYQEDPYPGLLTRLAASHPAPAERIALAEGWKATRPR